MASLEERLTELETRLAFVDDAVQSLGDAIALHDRQMLAMRNAMERLSEELVEARNALGQVRDARDEPLPPHY
ncbi:MAG: SlyX family protein [Xanthomonadales bacterium]|nr:SlyX family protein [Xanthomonadales bacterium]